MNTAAEPKAIKDFFALPIDLVFPNPDNPRRITDDHPSLPGLAAAIKAVGQLAPIVVRKRAASEGWEILAGERRWRAMRLAGLTTIDARTRAVDDRQAFEITVVENLQREDLHWLEEARGVETMTKRGWDVATIASHVGKSEAWVRLRAKLATLSPKWRKAAENPDSPVHLWPTAMLEMIARFPVATQDEIIGNDAGDLGYELSEVRSAPALRAYLDREYLHALKAAPWDVNDANLVKKAGACSACPKRSSCQQQLFAESKDDQCLDTTCWNAKAEAQVLAAVAAAKKETPKAILLGESYSAPATLRKQVQPEYQYKTVKEGTKGAVPAVFVTGEKAGTTAWVAPGREPSVGSRAASTDKPKQASPKERLAEFLKRRTRHAIGLVVAKLGGDPDASGWEASRKKPKATHDAVQLPELGIIVSLALTHGLDDEAGLFGKAWKRYDELVAMGPVARTEELWDAVRAKLIPALIFDANYANPTGAMHVCKACALSWQSFVNAARDALPLPKTLAAHFDEDGHPLKALTAKAKHSTAGRVGRAAKA